MRVGLGEGGVGWGEGRLGEGGSGVVGGGGGEGNTWLSWDSIIRKRLDKERLGEGIPMCHWLHRSNPSDGM